MKTVEELRKYGFTETEEIQRMQSLSDETVDIVLRWITDLGFAPPEAYNWRWSIIAQELDGRLNPDKE